MTQKTVLPPQVVGYLGGIVPAAIAASTVTSGWISAAQYQSFMAIIAAGVLGASATLDAKIQQATDNAGTGAKDVTGLAITQMVKATDDNKQAVLGFATDSLDIANGFAWFRVSMTIGTAASAAAAIILGMDQRIGSVANTDASTVKEIILV
jgi:hypothetical protein